jgi:hypothetical protein
MKAETTTFGEHEFWLVGSPQLRRTKTGEFEEYVHQLDPGVRRNAHSDGPFCRFGIPSAPNARGVYAVTVNGELRYVGECEDLAKRFSSSGYGQIQPRNCHDDGQSTNCKLNSRILIASKVGDDIQIWFHPTEDQKRLESTLINALNPPWNGRSGDSPQDQRRTKQSTPKRVTPSFTKSESDVPSADRFLAAIRDIIDSAGRQGLETVQVRAGDFHRELGGYPSASHRMPVCCAAMRKAMGPRDRIVQQPPKGDGANLIVEYHTFADRL